MKESGKRIQVILDIEMEVETVAPRNAGSPSGFHGIRIFSIFIGPLRRACASIIPSIFEKKYRCNQWFSFPLTDVFKPFPRPRFPFRN